MEINVTLKDYFIHEALVLAVRASPLKGLHGTIRQMTLITITSPLVFHSNSRYGAWPNMAGNTVFSHLHIMGYGGRSSREIGSP